MMKIIKLLLIGILGVTVTFSHSPASAETEYENPIYLKLGEFYILHTKPLTPFLDKQGRLLIPLRSIQDLMGGTVTYNSISKTATVNFLDHTFQFTISSKTAFVDNKKNEMDTIPILKNNAMFLPIRLILDNTDIQWSWNSKLQYLHIQDARVIKGMPFEQFNGNDFAEIKSDDAFHLKSYVITNQKQLKIRAINISADDIVQGKADIQPLVSYANQGGFSVDSYTRPINPPLPAVKKGEEVIKTVTFDLTNASYIISVGRELK